MKLPFGKFQHFFKNFILTCCSSKMNCREQHRWIHPHWPSERIPPYLVVAGEYEIIMK